MHFLAGVLKIKSNLILILARISVEIRTGKERSYGSIFFIVAMFPPTLVKVFLTILDRHFPKSHKLYKIFNWNNVKISYSSLPNFARIINSYNKKIINNNIARPSASTCNCHSNTSCSLNGDCLQSSLVYICKANRQNIIENHPHYIRLTENTFKKTNFTSTKTHSNMKVNLMQWNYQISNGKISMLTLKRILCGIY